MLPIKSLNLAFVLLFIGVLSGTSATYGASPKNEVLAHWNFDQIKHLKGDSVSIPKIGQPLTASDRGSTEPQP